MCLLENAEAFNQTGQFSDLRFKCEQATSLAYKGFCAPTDVVVEALVSQLAKRTSLVVVVIESILEVSLGLKQAILKLKLNGICNGCCHVVCLLRRCC